MTTCRFTVPGRPVAKQRPRIGYPSGKDGKPDRTKPFLYQPADTVRYERVVGKLASAVFAEPLEGPLRATLRGQAVAKGQSEPADDPGQMRLFEEVGP